MNKVFNDQFLDKYVAVYERPWADGILIGQTPELRDQRPAKLSGYLLPLITKCMGH